MSGRARLANEAWEALLRAHTVLMRRFTAAGLGDDISLKEYDVLYTLSKAEGGLRLTELNRDVLLSQPALSRMIDRLAERGLVSRCSDPRDGRGVIVALSEDGRKVQRDAGWRHGREVTRAVSDALDEQEMLRLAELLEKLSRGSS